MRISDTCFLSDESERKREWFSVPLAAVTVSSKLTAEERHSDQSVSFISSRVLFLVFIHIQVVLHMREHLMLTIQLSNAETDYVSAMKCAFHLCVLLWYEYIMLEVFLNYFKGLILVSDVLRYSLILSGSIMLFKNTWKCFQFVHTMHLCNDERVVGFLIKRNFNIFEELKVWNRYSLGDVWLYENRLQKYI